MAGLEAAGGAKETGGVKPLWLKAELNASQETEKDNNKLKNTNIWDYAAAQSCASFQG